MFHDFNKDINYILKRVIIGVIIALILGFIGTRKVQALDTVTFNEWQFVYRDNTVGQIWDNTFTYRLGEQKSLLAINIYWPSFSGYYNGTVTFQLDPVQFPSQPNGFLTNQYFKLFVYQNGSYSQQYYVGTCDGQWTCTFNFQGTAEQSANSRFSVQLLINNEAFSTAYIYYPAGRVSASVFASNEANTGNQDIINNQNENTQQIINNQNENTQQIIDSNQVCKFINKDSIAFDNRFLNVDGTTTSYNDYGITDYISTLGSDISFTNYLGVSAPRICFYDEDKTVLSCPPLSNYNVGSLTLPEHTAFIRISIKKSVNKPTLKICTNGNQYIGAGIEDIQKGLNDDNIDENFVSDFFNTFSSNSHGVSGVITAPFRLLNSLTTATCSPLEFRLPFVHNTVTLPCMRGIYEEHFGTFFSLWQMITTGLISYSVMINMYSKIHNLQNPKNDRIEVLNL